MADETMGARKKHADAMKAMEEAVQGRATRGWSDAGALATM